MPPIEKERIERAARIYARDIEANKALDIHADSFSRLSRLYDIEKPRQRKRRRRPIQ